MEITRLQFQVVWFCDCEPSIYQTELVIIISVSCALSAIVSPVYRWHQRMFDHTWIASIHVQPSIVMRNWNVNHLLCISLYQATFWGDQWKTGKADLTGKAFDIVLEYAPITRELTRQINAIFNKPWLNIFTHRKFYYC